MEDFTGGKILSYDLKKISAKLLEWKNKYRNIYYFKIGTHEYIFRLLTKGEYLALYFVQFHISDKAEDILLSKCVLYPEIDDKCLDNLLAGEVNTLIDKILSLSGFSNLDNIKEDLDKERQNLQLLDNQIVLLICKAFPHITPTDIDNFDYPTTLHYISLAEELLGTKLEITKQEDTNKINFEKENIEQGYPGGPFRGGPSIKK